MKVALVTNIPRPYRAPLFESLLRSLAATQSELKVFFYSDIRGHARRRGSPLNPAQYPNTLVSGWDIPLGFERVVSIPWPLLPSIGRYQPDVIISGTFGLPGILAWLYARVYNIPYIQWSGATILRRGQRGSLAALVQRFLARRAHAGLAYGSAARDYLVHLGMPREQIVVGVNTVDVEAFATAAIANRAWANRLKADRGLEGIQLLYVGNLVPLKGVSYVLSALAAAQSTGINCHLHLVGAGPFESELRNQAESLGISAAVHFWGSVAPVDVPRYYALADIFVFPSLYDVWGLVLNEAMACGVPVIASTLAGATQDLVEHGHNGLVVNPQDTSALANALTQLARDKPLRLRLGEAAAATIRRKATIEHSAAAFLQAIQLALTKST